MEEFLRRIGINGTLNTSDDGCLVMDIANSDEYGKVLSKLERCQELEEDEDSSILTYESSSTQFINDKYLVTLIGDLEGDTYKLTIKEL